MSFFSWAFCLEKSWKNGTCKGVGKVAQRKRRGWRAIGLAGMTGLLIWTLWISIVAAEWEEETVGRGQSAPDHQVMLVTINRLGQGDLAEMPHLQRLAQQGAAGFMNVNTGDRKGSAAAAYATIAEGVPTSLGAPLVAYSRDETMNGSPAVDVYRQTFDRPAGDSRVLLLSMAALEKRRSQREFAGRPGSLGDELRAQGLQAAVYGNADRGPSASWRPGVLLASDGEGRVDFGDVSSRTTQVAPDRPYGERTDYNALWTSYQHAASKTALAVFDLADLDRLSAYQSQLAPERYADLHRQTLQEIDNFLAEVEKWAGPRRLVMVVSPQAASSQSGLAAERLAPVVLAGGDIAPGTVLTSATTRRAGIVSNLDLAPTLLGFLGAVQPAEMIGYPLEGTDALAQDELPALNRNVLWRYEHRSAVLTMVGVLAGLGLIGAVLRLLGGVPIPLRLLRAGLWSVLALPLALYVLPLQHPQNLWAVAGGVLATQILLVFLPFRIAPFCRELHGRILWLAGCTFMLVVGDICTGGRLAGASLLSYDPIVGARYYGIGNEYMGVLIGCSLLVYGAWRHKILQRAATRGESAIDSVPARRTPWFSRLALLGGALLTLFFASPSLGTNTGGTLTMAGTVALLIALQRRWRPLPALGLLTGAIALAFAGLWWLNASPVSSPSHIGAATHLVLQGGAPEVWRILARKGEMFRRLLFSSIWPTALLGVQAFLLWWLTCAPNRTASWRQRSPHLVTALTAGAGGGIIGLFTNDSGIVVLAMMSLFASFPLFLIWLEGEEEIEAGFLRRSA
jgi:hypothetical protein